MVPINAGNPWTYSDKLELVEMAVAKESIEYLASCFGRSNYAIECQLENLKDKINAAKFLKTQPTTTPEKFMSVKVTTQQFVGTRSANELSVGDLLSAIEQDEAFIKRLSKIKARSNAITKLITEHERNVGALTELLTKLIDRD